MEVNREFWDGTTTTYNEDGAERVTVLSDKLWTKIQANPGKYIGKDWDKSICPWKIGNGSDLFKTMWCLPYANLENQFTFTSSPFYKERKKGYTFYLSCNGTPKSGERPGNKSNSVATSPVWLGTLSRNDIDIEDTVTANWLNLKSGDINPVINFDYSNIFIVPIIYNSANVGLYITSNTETNWNADDVYGLGFIFYQKQADGTSSTVTAMDIISLNNKIDKPLWTVTNSWNEDTMFDNTLALQKYLSWDGGYEISCYTAIGSHLQTGDTYIDGANYPGNGFNYDNPKLATDDAAGSVYYIPNKQISVAMPANDSDIWEDEFTPLYLGAEYNFGIHRHLKSFVTYSQFIEYVKKQLAFIGFRFCVFAEDINKNINSEYYYIPVINEKGVTTGNYYVANSTEAQNLPNNSWNTNVYSVTPYDGTDDEEEDDPDPNTYDDNTVLNPTGNTINNRFTSRYILSPTNLNLLSRFLYEVLPTQINDLTWSPKNLLVNNPIDAVISLQFFPFNVYNYQTEEIYLQNIYLGTQEVKINEQNSRGYNCVDSVIVVDMGKRRFYPKFGVYDFRSFRPYTNAELYLPYCGSIPIDPETFLNKWIGVKYLVDLSTGSCIALISVSDSENGNDMTIDAITGQIGITVPITGIENQTLAAAQNQANAQYKNARNNALLKTAGAVGAIAGGVASGNALMVGSGIVSATSAINDIQQMQYSLQHTEIPYKTIGTSTPQTSYKNEQRCRLIITECEMLPTFDAEKYGHSVGFATIETDTIGNYTGYTEITGVDLSGFTATEEEKTLIRTALESGVYL